MKNKPRRCRTARGPKHQETAQQPPCTDDEYLFELVDGVPHPVIPHDDRAPDGVRFLSLQQMVDRYGFSVDQHRRDWASYCLDEGRAADAAAEERTELELVRKVLHPTMVNESIWQFVLRECRRLGVDPADVRTSLKHDKGMDFIFPVIRVNWRMLQRRAKFMAGIAAINRGTI